MSTSSAMPANATMFLIRHAEKPESGTGLSREGQKRADAYVKYFQSLKDPKGKAIRWDHLFACKDSENSDRPVLTITPLATALEKKIHHEFKDKLFAELVTHFQQNAKLYAGSNIVICWHHGKILDLAGAMGASPGTLPSSSNWPKQWPGTVFGWLLQMYYKPDGTLDLKSTQAINEKLMPDDTVDPVYDK
jgi:hypothetical protein